MAFPSAHRIQEAELRRVALVKQQASARRPVDALGPQLIDFFKHSVQKRQVKLAKVAGAWEKLVPQMLAEHTALESLSRGTLTVLVDSASHLYELKQLLLAGLQQQLFLACAAAGLKKIVLRAGRWYDDGDDLSTGADPQASRKLRFND